MGSRETLRVLRTAPQFGVRDVLGVAGMSLRQLRAQIRGLDARGGCAAAAAAAATGKTSAATRAKALKHPACPPYAARAAGADRTDSVREAARGAAGWSTRGWWVHNVPRSVFVARAASGYTHMRQAVVTRLEFPSAARVALCASRGSSLSVREALAFPWGGSEAHVVAALAADPDETIRALVVRHRSASRYLRTRLATDTSLRVRVEAAKSGDVSDEALEGLASDPEHAVRSAVAALRPHDGRGGCPPRLLRLLSRDAHTEPRMAAAANPANPADVLKRLCGDDEPQVRAAVAVNPAATTGVLERLTGDRHRQVRSAVAAHLSTPQPTLVRLAADRAVAVRMSLAQRYLCPEPVLDLLAGDPKEEVRSEVAARPELSAGLHRLLSDDEDPVVSWTAQRNYHARQRSGYTASA